MSTLSKGASGRQVQRLQGWLNTLGYALPIDSQFGPEDEKAVRDFQATYFFPVTGVVDSALFNQLKRLARDTSEGDFVPKIETPRISVLEPQPLVADFTLPELKKISAATPEAAPVASRVSEKVFTSLAEGRQEYDAIMRSNLPPAQKSALAAALRKKVITDIYGKAYRAEIEAFRAILQQQVWLLPEGDEAYMQLITDSENFFKDGFYRRGIYFSYTLERIKNTDNARFTVHAVRNNMSNLVYSSSLVARQINAQEIEISIFLSRNQGYAWAESRADYLRVLFNVKNERISAAPVGAMGALQDMGHGYPQADTEKKVIARHFTIKNAIKTALRYFILNYSGALRMA